MRIDENSIYNNKNLKLVNISDLKSGDVFRAEIMDIKQNEMILKLLGNNSLISAKTLKIFGLKIGEFVNFKVTSNNNNQLMLEPMINVAQDAEKEVIHNTLRNSNLPDNDISTELVKKMLDNSIPFGKEALTNIYNLLKQNPKLDVDKLMILLNNNIPVSEESISKLNSFINEKKHINVQVKEFVNSLENMIKEPKTEETIIKSMLATTLKIPKSVSSHISELLKNNTEITTAVNIQEFKNALNNLKLSDNEKLEMISFLNNSDDGLDKKLIYDFIKENMPEVLKMIKNKFEIKFDNNNLENINEVYKNLYRFATSLGENLNGVENTDKGILNNVSDIKQKIEFMNQILQYDTYLQIPLKVNNTDYNPELYVLKNKKKKLSSSNVTALLCLDLVKLGYTEILINKNLNNVSCKFRLEDMNSKETFSKYMSDLKLRLSELGYNLINVGYDGVDTKTNIINKNSLLPDDKNKEGKIHSFDIRV